MVRLITDTRVQHLKLLAESQWDEAFLTHEALSSVERVADAVEDQRPKIEDPDELARAAGKVIDAVRHEQNPKFKNSEFLGLMKQLRDREVVVEGDKMIPKEEATRLASDLQPAVDVKGKGRAVPVPMSSAYTSIPLNISSTSALQGAELDAHVDDVAAYFEQENESYISYWHGVESQQPSQQKDGSSAQGSRQGAEWEQLQSDWDRYEATATGMRVISNYQFQENNPYVLGEASKTRHHTMHNSMDSLYEVSTYFGPAMMPAHWLDRYLYSSQSVLELEAAVQRDPHNAAAWFELGVKQQENEREQKAIHALRRALELDPACLPAWLALAVSHTNDGNRVGAYEAVQDWVSRNNRYAAAVAAHRAAHAVEDGAAESEKFSSLIDCLITMARSDTSGQVDADIQIALAILMNTDEVRRLLVTCDALHC